MKLEQKDWIRIGCALVLGIVSFFVLGSLTSKPDFFAKTISYLDDKKMTVLKLSASSAATSVAITALPGDVATPIANKLTDLSGYFIVITAAVYLEKYLATVGGALAFRYIIPIACLIYIVYVLLKSPKLKQLALKALLAGLILFAIIPCSVAISQSVEKSYTEQITATIDAANEQNTEIEEETEKEESSGILGAISSAVSDKVEEYTEQFNTTLSNFIDAIAVLIVTSCLIPIGVMLLLLWAANALLGLNMDLSGRRRRGRPHLSEE